MRRKLVYQADILIRQTDQRPNVWINSGLNWAISHLSFSTANRQFCDVCPIKSRSLLRNLDCKTGRETRLSRRWSTLDPNLISRSGRPVLDLPGLILADVLKFDLIVDETRQLQITSRSRLETGQVGPSNWPKNFERLISSLNHERTSWVRLAAKMSECHCVNPTVW